MAMACAIFLFLGGMVGMMWTGGQDVLAGRMSGGDLGAFVFYAVMLGSAFATLSEVWGDLQRAPVPPSGSWSFSIKTATSTIKVRPPLLTAKRSRHPSSPLFIHRGPTLPLEWL